MRARLFHVVAPTTAVWFVAFAVLLFFVDDLRAADRMIWLWTCLAGWILGLVGLAVYAWQRRAARRGAGSANRMALQERI